MARRTKITAIVFGAFVFIGISLLLSRALVGSGAERAKVRDILEAQAAGDIEALLDEMPRCKNDPVCSRVTTERTGRLKRPGTVEILNFEPTARATFTTQTGTARVAWRTSEKSYPVVQCVVIRREGPLSGGKVIASSISNPIGLEAKCND